MKLSIIVPVYNMEKYIGKCLDSLVESEDKDYEIIVVNDGSTDRSGTIVKEYRERCPGKIHMIETPNGGLGHARNTGLASAKGENILFVDSDDYLKPGALTEILGFLQEDFDITVFDFTLVNEAGKQLETVCGCQQKECFSLDSNPELLFSPMNAWNKIWKRELFYNPVIRFPDRLWFEELATTPKLFLRAARILPIHKNWYCYLQRDGSIMNTAKVERNREMITVIHSVLEWFQMQNAYKRFQEALTYMAFYHECLTAVVRVNLLDPKCELQKELRDDFLSAFPEYRNCPYILKMPRKYRLLEWCIHKGHWAILHFVMCANNMVKGKT